MNRFFEALNYYFSSDFLLTPNSGTKFELFYLVFSLFILIGLLFLVVFLKVRKASEAYREFNKIWIWGALIFGLLGLWIWFSRNQSLALFSTRIISYFWILGIILFSGYLLYYWKRILPNKVTLYFEKKRKEKYLKR